uniref:Uncharacterized protein n=1 Tax=Arundo donax TaxID=35708 RepID=A0A0A8Z216_ARUDO
MKDVDSRRHGTPVTYRSRGVAGPWPPRRWM